MTAQQFEGLIVLAGGRLNLSKLSGIDRRSIQRMERGTIEIATRRAARLMVLRVRLLRERFGWVVSA